MTRTGRLSWVIAVAGLAAWPAQAQEGPQAGAEAPAPLLDLDLDSLSATRELPLFTPSRSPPPPAPVVPELPPAPVLAPAPPPPPPPPALQLLGIVAAQTDRVAVLSDPTLGTVHRLRSGDDYNGWTMRIVDGRTVEFTNAESKQTLTLFQDFGAAPPPPTGAGPPAGAPEPEL